LARFSRSRRSAAGRSDARAFDDVRPWNDRRRLREENDRLGQGEPQDARGGGRLYGALLLLRGVQHNPGAADFETSVGLEGLAPRVRGGKGESCEKKPARYF